MEVISDVGARGATAAARVAVCWLALACALPKLAAATNQNYVPAGHLSDLDGLLGDTRTQYQFMEGGGEPGEPSLLMASDLLSSLQPKQDYDPRPRLQHRPQESAQQQQQPPAGRPQQESPPGHYEFEVAPKMEPPAAPKPPFEQANVACPGSDPFGGFSPKHTLCGDLYQGRVPLNPMGQFVNEQAYPFELIKNKTLQFLARSLPILKSEYETIPKVARYLPANQLLNPTSHRSPLGHEHFHTLNQLEHQSAPELLAGLGQPVAPPFLRRKRSAAGAQQLQQASITVAELMPNATLVVSSAHSSAGRIGHHLLGPRPSEPLPSQQFLMITKDGQRSTAPAGDGPASLPMWVRGQHDSEAGGGKSPAHSDHQGQTAAPQPAAKSHAANQFQRDTTGPARERTHAMSPHQQTIESKATNSDANNQRQQQHLLARSAPALAEAAHQQAEPAGSGAQAADPHRAGLATAFAGAAPRAAGKQAGAGSGAAPLKCSNVNGLLMYTVCQAASALIEPAESTPSWLQAAKQIGSLYAAASNSDSYSSGPTSSPLWALWSALAPGPAADKSAGPTYALTSAAAADSPADSQASQDLTYKSSNGNQHHKSPIHSVAGVISLLNPLMSLFGPSLQRAGDAGGGHSRAGLGKPDNRSAHHSALSAASLGGLKTLSNLLLTGLSLAGLYDWLGGAGILAPTSTTFARRKKPFDPSETFVDTPASLAALASAKQLSPAASAGPSGAAVKQPPTPCPSVEEYISPTFARNYQGAWKYVVQIPHEGYFTQTIQRSSCMRQKCEFTDGVCHEAPRWVSLLVAEIYYPNAIFGAGSAPSQVATDRLSLDAGVQTNAAMLNQLMAAAPSNSQLQQAVALGAAGSGAPLLNGNQQQQLMLLQQAKSLGGAHQDPLQMTDSLNNYNHKLNSAFISAATELGLDPMNVAQMQQLANAHNYQFLQRNGLMPTQQAPAPMPTSQAPAEPRSGFASAPNQHARPPQRSTAQQVVQQFVEPAQSQQVFGSDYIKALALETIRRHPHLSIDDLIKSLQMQQTRKKRDLSSPAGQQMSSAQFSHKIDSLGQPSHQQRPAQALQQNPQAASSLAESLPSINEISLETHLAQQQHPFNPAGLASGPQLSTGQHQYQQMLGQPDGNRHANFPRSGQLDQQTTQMVASQASPGHDANQASAQAGHLHQHQGQAEQHQQQQQDSAGVSSSGGQGNAAGNAPGADSQVECDGHDKIGCYVVRVYYDWFLVNGSCKCWKTSAPGQQAAGQSAASNASAGFIRRIFTG